MSSILPIKIIKNKHLDYQIYVDNNQITFDVLKTFIKSNGFRVLHIQTFENQKLLMNTYIPFNEISFNRIFNQIAMAKIGR